MLGVLAVVGVLSVGGIAGYTYAMSKHHANELLAGASQRVIVAVSQLISGRAVNLSEFDKDNVKSGGTFLSEANTEYDGEIGINITNVNQRTCQELIRSITETSVLRGVAVTGTYADITTEECQETNNLTLFYNNDMSTNDYNTACQNDSDCLQAGLSSAYKCNTTEGICEIQCASNRTYVDGYGCCPNDRLWNGGCCSKTIQEVDGIKMCCQGSTCCSEGQIYDSKTKKCIACEDVTGVIWNTYFASCSMCPNLVQVSKWQCAPGCTDPDAILVDGICKCPLDRPLMASDNPANPKCLPCDYNGSTGNEIPYGINTSYSSFTGNYCNRHNGSGYSYYCEPGTVGVSWNTSIVLSDGSSYKETASYGSCKDCSEVDISALKYQASCISCGGTWDGDSWDNGTCIP